MKFLKSLVTSEWYPMGIALTTFIGCLVSMFIGIIILTVVMGVTMIAKINDFYK